MFVVITENFWTTFWRTFWRSLFDAVQNSSFKVEHLVEHLVEHNNTIHFNFFDKFLRLFFFQNNTILLFWQIFSTIFFQKQYNTMQFFWLICFFENNTMKLNFFDELFDDFLTTFLIIFRKIKRVDSKNKSLLVWIYCSWVSWYDGHDLPSWFNESKIKDFMWLIFVLFFNYL